jgi:hypothetical protein
MEKPLSVPTLWVVGQRNLWGDFGDALISGDARRETDDGPLSLHRTGPFLPPISFPWITNTGGYAVVVTSEFKQQLEELKLPDVTFREAAKTRIIPLAWERWDRSSRVPRVPPDEGEPENYIEDKAHDPNSAAKMSRAFELVAPVGPVGVDQVEDPEWGYLDEFEAETIPAEVPPITRSHPTHGRLVVNEWMKAWLGDNAGEWVRFSPVRLAKPGRPPRR